MLKNFMMIKSVIVIEEKHQWRAVWPHILVRTTLAKALTIIEANN